MTTATPGGCQRGLAGACCTIVALVAQRNLHKNDVVRQQKKIAGSIV